MKIRKANTGDIQEICELFFETIKNINCRDYNEKQIAVWTSGYNDFNKWSGKIANQNFYVAENEGLITGFASVTDEGYIDYMYVHKDFQNSGIASSLLKVIEQTASDLKLKKLWAEVSLTARPFFKSKEFEITKVFFKKTGDVEFEDCIMTKIFDS
jgi:putative acetyltransferase